MLPTFAGRCVLLINCELFNNAYLGIRLQSPSREYVQRKNEWSNQKDYRRQAR